MDNVRFDALTRALGALAGRRAATRAMTAGALGLLALVAGHDAKAKKKKGKKKKKKKSGACKANQEKCGQACCSANQACIDGECLGQCQFVEVVTDTESRLVLAETCAASATIVVPDGFILDGNGNTIHMAGPVSGYDATTIDLIDVRAGLLIQNGRGSIRNVTIDQDALECEEGLTQSAIVMANGRGDIGSAEGPVEIAVTKNNRNCYRSGISAQVAGNNDAINVRNVTITGNRFSGIALSGPAAGGQAVAGEIRECTITGPGFGMILSDSKHFVTDNIVTAGIGLTVDSFPTDVFVDGNTFTGPNGQTNVFGVNFGGDADGSASNNTVSNFTCGIAIQPGPGEVILSNNTFTENTTNVCDPP